MPRRPRIIVPGLPTHLIQRGNNRQACFITQRDYEIYLEWLGEYSLLSGCAVHAYVMMTNHIHLLVTPTTESSIAQLMRRLGQRYTQYINRTYKRSGTLWENRFRSSVISQDDYLIVCQKYIELNPVRAGMVKEPAEYLWSSYRINAYGEKSGLVTPHPLIANLGNTMQQRLTAYRDLFQDELPSGTTNELRRATNGNFAFGNERFCKKLAEYLGYRVTPGKAGRPSTNKFQSITYHRLS